MSIKDYGEKIKSFKGSLLERLGGEEGVHRWYTATIVVLVGLSSFGLGRLSILDEAREPIVIEETSVPEAANLVQTPQASGNTQTAAVSNSLSSANTPAETPATGKIMASKNGTRYYFAWCSSNIAEKNKIWFNSEAEARAKGLLPAANCKGLK